MTSIPTATTTRVRPARAVVAGLALLAVLAAGCGTGPDGDADPTAAPTATATTSPDPTPTTEAPTATVPTARPTPATPAAQVARAIGELAVYAAPGDTEAASTLPATTVFGSRTVALVTEAGDGTAEGWLEVLLPVRPNGSTGWVRAADVDLREVDLEVRVDLAARELVVLEAGEELLATPAAIGDPDHPTPTGRFYVTDKLETPDASGAYGPYAIGLAAHSDVLTEFAGGDGQIGIHGTNDPGSIGQDVSHGCVRIPNDVVVELAHLLPLGTPVTIT